MPFSLILSKVITIYLPDIPSNTWSVDINQVSQKIDNTDNFGARRKNNIISKA